MERLSILHIGKFYPPHSGGMESHLHDLATRQTPTANVSVIVANRTWNNESSVVNGVKVTRVARIFTVASMPVCPGLSSAIRRTPADIVHIHMPNPGAAQAFLMSGHTGRLVITHHADMLGRKALRRLSDPFVTKVMQRAECIIVTSKRYLDSSTELAPYRDKCTVIPLGIDLGAISGADHAMTARLGEELGDRMILAIGRLVPYKGFDVLIRAMKHIDAKLVLIGAGPQYRALGELAAVEGVSEKIVMPGWVNDIRSYLAAASIFVLPSVTRAEAFGIVQLEAMAAGLPVINTNIDSGVPEVSVDGKTGITVAPGDEVALSTAVRLLLDRPELRKQYGDAAMKAVNDSFTADLMAERTMSTYTDVLAAQIGR